MRDKLFRLVLSVLLVGSYFFFPKYGFTSSFLPLTQHLCYPFSHANIWHLAGNVLCLWMLRCRLHVVVTYSTAVLCSFLPCFAAEPTMGYSGALFAMVGISWGKIGRFKDMMWRNKWILIIPAFLPHVNFMIHIYCLMMGYLFGVMAESRHTMKRGLKVQL